MAADDEYNLTVTDESLRDLRYAVEDAKSRADTALRRRQVLYPSGGGGGAGAIGRALTAIAPASSNLLGSPLEFVRFVVDSSVSPQTTPKTLKEEQQNGAPKRTKAVNRSTKLTAGVDAFVQLHRVNSEWVLLTAEDVCEDDT